MLGEFLGEDLAVVDECFQLEEQILAGVGALGMLEQCLVVFGSQEHWARGAESGPGEGRARAEGRVRAGRLRVS